MATPRFQQISVLTMTTVAFMECFAVWMMFSIIEIPLKENPGLSETEFGILVAMPILTGSPIRILWAQRKPSVRAAAHVK